MAGSGDRSLVARLAAVKSLKEMIDVNFSSNKHVFVTCMPHYTKAMFSVLFACRGPEAREQVLLVLRSAIARVGSGVKSSISSLQEGFPKAWSLFEQQNILRQSLLKLLSAVVNSLESESVALFPFVLPILKYCLEPREQAERGYLTHDTLLLWRALLRMTPSAPTPSVLLQVFSGWFHLMSNSNDGTDILIEIFESHFLLFGGAIQPFLSQYLKMAAPICSSLLHDLTNPVLPKSVRLIGKLCDCLELLLVAFPTRFSETSVLTLPLIPSLLASLTRHVQAYGLSTSTNPSKLKMVNQRLCIVFSLMICAAALTPLLFCFIHSRCLS